MFHGKINYKWSCSIAMLNYQRVCPLGSYIITHPTWEFLLSQTMPCIIPWSPWGFMLVIMLDRFMLGGQFPKPQVGMVGVGYPLVNKRSNIAIENAHRNSGFTH